MWKRDTIRRDPDWALGTPLIIYSDASKTGRNVGYGWVVTDNDYVIAESVKSAKEIDVYQAEVMAIQEALSWIKDFPTNGREVVLLSDSLSAVQAINGCIANNWLLWETMKLLCVLRETLTINIYWVKGHTRCDW